MRFKRARPVGGRRMNPRHRSRLRSHKGRGLGPKPGDVAELGGHEVVQRGHVDLRAACPLVIASFMPATARVRAEVLHCPGVGTTTE